MCHTDDADPLAVDCCRYGIHLMLASAAAHNTANTARLPDHVCEQMLQLCESALAERLQDSSLACLETVQELLPLAKVCSTGSVSCITEAALEAVAAYAQRLLIAIEIGGAGSILVSCHAVQADAIACTC